MNPCRIVPSYVSRTFSPTHVGRGVHRFDRCDCVCFRVDYPALQRLGRIVGRSDSIDHSRPSRFGKRQRLPFASSSLLCADSLDRHSDGCADAESRKGACAHEGGRLSPAQSIPCGPGFHRLPACLHQWSFGPGWKRELWDDQVVETPPAGANRRSGGIRA
jgi:hypothetical protein